MLHVDICSMYTVFILKVIILLISFEYQIKNTAIIRGDKGYARKDEITFYNPNDSGVFTLLL